MKIYVGRRYEMPTRVMIEMDFVSYLNDDGTYDIYKNRFDGTTPRGVSRSVILHYIVNRGVVS